MRVTGIVANLPVADIAAASGFYTDYLGLSVEGATPTWGKMIVAGSSGTTLRTAPLSAFVPITAMFLTVLALNFIGDRLRAHFEVRESAL